MFSFNKRKKILQVHRALSTLLMIGLVLPSLVVFPEIASAATTAIRQEVNVIDDYFNSTTSVAATSSAIIQIDTNQYSGATYYLEAVASTTDGTTAANLYLQNASTYAAVASVTAQGATLTRYRSSPFTPTAGANNYVATWGREATGKSAAAVRVVILQSADPIALTETQIEIGSQVNATTSANTTPLSSPKYWLYDDSKWDGSPTFSAEVTYQLGAQTSSSTIFRTATTSAATTTVPTVAGISYLFVEAWGAGGGGSNAATGGGGGGGGAYAAQLFATSSGSVNTLLIARGGMTDLVATSTDTHFNKNGGASTTQVVAAGGNTTAGNTGGAGGTTALSIGQIKFAGGNGGLGNTTNDVGAGGGGAGGPDGKGVTASNAGAGAPSAGGNGNATSGNGYGAGGAAGTTRTDACSTTKGLPGVNHVRGGGGGGGANGDATNLGCLGGPGGAPGGGGGGSEYGLTTATSTGAAGQIKLTETHGRVGIALEEDNGSFVWAFKQQIVTEGESTSTPVRVRVSFTPTTGSNYRIVASSTNSAVNYSIYNAKIIVNQSSPTLLEPQYLLANKLLRAGTSQQAESVSWFDPGDWTNTTNTYYHESSGPITGGTSDIKLQNGTSSANDITNSPITDVNQRERSASALTMSSTATTTAVIATTNGGDLYSSRIIVQVAPPAAATLTFSGRVYNNEGTSELTTAGKSIILRVGTSTAGLFATSTVAANGFWQIPSIAVTGFFLGMPISLWVDGDTSFRAFTFTKASTTDMAINNLDLYKDYLIVRHEGTGGGISTSTTNADLGVYDHDDDDSIQFTSNANVLSVYATTSLFVAPGAIFRPGGAVTLNGNGLSSNPDGDLRLAVGAGLDGVATTSLLAMEANALTLAGNWFASSSAQFTHTGTVTFNSTSSATKLIVATSTTFNTLTFNGVGGSWSFGANAATTSGAFTITNGTVTAPSSSLTLQSNFTQNGTFTGNSGIINATSSSAQTFAGTMTGTSALSNIEFFGVGTKSFSNYASTSNFLIGPTSGAVTAPFQLTIGGNYTNSGTFTAGSGTVFASSSSAQTFSGTMVGTSAFATTTFAGAGTKSFSNNASTSNLTIDASSGAVTAPSLITLAGNFINNSIFTAGSGTIYATSSSAQTFSGNMVDSSALSHLLLLGVGVKTFNNNASTSNLTVGTSSALTAPSLLTIGGNFTQAGTFTAGSGTVYGTSSSAQVFMGSMVGANAFNHLELSGAGAKTISNNASTTNFISSSSVTIPALLTIGGNFTQNGVFTAGSGTIYATSSSAQTFSGTMVGSSAFANIEFSGAGSKTFSNNASTTNFTNTSTFVAPTLLTIGGNYINNGVFTAGSGTVYGTSSSAQSFAGNMVGASSFANLQLSGAGAKTFSNNASTTDFLTTSSVTAPTLLTIGGNYTNNGVFTAGSGTVYATSSSAQTFAGGMIGANAFSSLELSGAGAKTFNNNASTTNFTNTSPFTAPTLLSIGGNYTNNGVFTAGSGTVFASSSSAQTFAGNMVGSSAFSSTTFIGTGTKTFSNNASTTAAFTISSGSTVVAPALLSVAGTYNNSGAFTAGTGRVYFNGTTQQTATGTMTGASAFRELTILNTSGDGTTMSVIFGAAASTTWTFTMVASTSAQFLKGAATSSFNGIDWQGGDASSPVWLRSSTSGTPWGLVATNTITVAYVNVKDSYACAGDAITVSNGAVDSGGNSCWTLGAPTVATQPATSLAGSATLYGNITAGSGSTVRGFAWGTNISLSGGDTATTTENGSFSTGAFSTTSLTMVCNTSYYSRAYATNVVGTGLGTIFPFNTATCLHQRDFMFYGDGYGSTVATSSIRTSSATSTTITSVKQGERLITRIQIDNTGTASSTQRYRLQWENNTVSPGVWNDFGTTTELRYGLSTQGAIAAGRGSLSLPTRQVTTACSGSVPYTAGRFVVGAGTSTAFTIPDSGCSELEYVIETTGATLGSTYRLRIVVPNATGTPEILNSYDQYPSLTIAGSATDVPRITKEARGLSASTTLPQPNDYGSTMSAIAIGSDGYPVMTYLDGGLEDLIFIKCYDASCGNYVQRVIDAGGGEESSIAIGSDGYPVISFEDYTARTFKFIKCNDLACANTTTRTFNTYAAAIDVRDSTVAIGVDGFPVIAYSKDFNDADGLVGDNMLFIKCADASCSATSSRTIDISGTGGYSSLAIGSDGFPVMSYTNYASEILKFAKCADIACTSVATSTIETDAGFWSSIAIGTDGYPVISSRKVSAAGLKITKCTNIYCTATTTNTFASANAVTDTSIAIGTDGYPVIAYRDAILESINFLKCHDASCSTSTTRVLENTKSNLGADHLPLAIGADGYPIMSYAETPTTGTYRPFRFMRCSSLDCSGTTTPSVDSQLVAASTTDLRYPLDDTGYTRVGTVDQIYDTLTAGTSTVMVYLATTLHGNSTDPIVTSWTGQLSIATSTYLQVWNRSNGAWETLASNISPTDGTDFTLNGTQSANLSQYYDASNNFTARVITGTTTYATTMKTDQFALLDTTPTMVLLHYRFRNDDSDESTASNLAAEDTAVPASAGVLPGDRTRLRMTISNTGMGSATNIAYRLEYASSSCGATYFTVPAYGSQTTQEWVSDFSQYLSNDSSTTNFAGSLEDPASKSFVAGRAVIGTNQTNAHTITKTQFSEFEYSIRSTSFAEANLLYCFRLTNAGSITNFSYSATPSITVKSAGRPQGGGSTGVAGNEGSENGNQQSGGTPGGGNDNPGDEGGGGGPPVGGGDPGGGGGGDSG